MSSCRVTQTLPTLSGPQYPFLADSQISATSSPFILTNQSIDLTFLAPVAVGQFIILVVQSGSLTGTNVITIPNGFIKLFGDDASYGVYAKHANGAEGDTFTVNDVEGAATVIGLKINGASFEVIDASAEAFSTANGPSILITQQAALLFSIMCRQAGNLHGAVPTGWNLVQWNFTKNSDGGPIYTAVAQLNQLLPGPTGVITWSGTAQSLITLGLRLR